MSSIRNILTAIAVIAVVAFAPYVAPMLGVASGTFLAAVIGAVVVVAGTMAIYAISNALAPNGQQKGLSADAGRATIRVTEGPRWLCAGESRQGGSVVFTEFDGEGNLWCVIVHSDSVLVDTIKYILDDIVVTLDGSGNVITNDFCLNTKKEPFKGSGTRVPYWQIWTTTYSSANPTPPPIAALTAALGSLWTADHKLVGTTYSVMKGKAIGSEDRYKVYKWRGPLGLGEPSLSIVGRWSRVYDPRDEDQVQDNFSTHLYTTNPVLIWAWFRTHPYGRRKPRSSINWEKVAEQAAICDEIIVGIEGEQKRYTCGVAIPESKARHIAETEILASCDAQLMFDDQGRAYINVGYYVAPTVSLTRNRDIVAMESVEATNGESETQGVIVRYIDPLADYIVQPSAAWLNPNYYEVGVPATFLVVDILACQNHNQAMRLAKSIGMRSQPIHKIVPTTGLRGLKARQARIVNINYDNTFSGDYEIVTPIEVDASGMFCGFGAVPMDSNRFILTAGEEKPRPVIENTSATADPTPPTGVNTFYRNNRLEWEFDAESRDDVTYDFEYAEFVDVGEPYWSGASTSMLQTFAYGGPVSENKTYLTRWRARTAAGVVTDWSTPSTFDIADDGKFTVDEKIRILIPTASNLESTWSSLSTAADALSISTAAVDAARSDWLAFLAAVSPGWNDTDTDSPVDRIAYRAVLSSYEAALELLRQQVGQGSDGAPGINVARVLIYRRAASSPTLPSNPATFTFASGGITGLNNGWTINVPATDGNPLWVSSASASAATATDTIAAAEWAAPVIAAQDGAGGTPGINSATVYLFQRTSSNTPPALPASALTYTFATGALSGTLGSWAQSLPVSGGSFRWVTTATALATGATDSIAPGEWAAASLLAQDGATGSAGVPGAGAFSLFNVLYTEFPTPNSIRKTEGSAAWNAKASTSQYSTTGCAVSWIFKPSTGGGLTTDPSADAGYNNVDYWLHGFAGQLYVYRNSDGPVTGALATVTTGDRLAVTSDNVTIRYYRNNIEIYSHPVNNPNESLCGVFNIFDPAQVITDITWSVAGSAGLSLSTWVAYANSPDGSIDFTTGAPGNRAYQGIALNKSTNVESGTASDYTWTKYIGPSTFGIVGTNAIANGNTVISTAAGGWTAAGAYSSESYKNGATVTFTAGQTVGAGGDVMVGLNGDGVTDPGYTLLDYSWYCASTGDLYIYEGTTGYGPFGTYTTSTVLTVQYDGSGIVYYLKDGVIVRKVTGLEAGQVLYFDSAIAGPVGTRFTVLSFTAGNASAAPIVPMIVTGATPALDVTGNTVRKPSTAVGAWDSSAYSATSFNNGAYVSFRSAGNGGAVMVGLSRNPASSSSYTDIDFVFYLAGGGTYHDCRIGSNIPGGHAVIADFGAYNSNDVFAVEYDGGTGNAKFYRNGSVVASFSWGGMGQTMYVDSSIADPGAAYTLISYSAKGATGAQGPQGNPGDDGDPGEDGANGLSIAASSPVLLVARTPSGNPKAGQLPKSTQMIVYDGFTDVTTSASYTRTTFDCSVTHLGGGLFSLTAVGSSGAYFDVTATVGSRSITMRIPTANPLDGSAASRASAATTAMNAGTSYAEIGFVDIVVANGATINVNATSTYSPANSGSGTRTVRQIAVVTIANFTDGGADTVAGSAVVGSAAVYIAGDGISEIGSVSASGTLVNSTGSPKQFRCKMFIAKYDGTTVVETTFGFAGAIEVNVA